MSASDDETDRFVRALALGIVADEEFEEEMARLGVPIDPARSPADHLAEAELPFVYGRMNA